MSRVRNNGVHNLSAKVLTTDERRALGMGLKFVPTPTRSPSIEADLDQLHRRISLHFFFKDKGDSSEMSRFRVRNPDWKPNRDVVPESVFREAHNDLSYLLKASTPRRGFNISSGIRKALRSLAADRSIVIKPADKNVGVNILDRQHYIALCMEHLGDAEVYQPIERDPTPRVLQQLRDLKAFEALQKTEGPIQSCFLSQSPLLTMSPLLSAPPLSSCLLQRTCRESSSQSYHRYALPTYMRLPHAPSHMRLPTYMRLPTCAFPRAPSHMRLPTCTSHMRLPKCAFPNAPSHMRLPKCAFSHAPSHVRLPTCAFPHAPSQMRLPTCAFPHAPSHMRLPTCAFPNAPSHMRLPTCAFPHAPSHMRLPTCTSHMRLPHAPNPVVPASALLYALHSAPCSPLLSSSGLSGVEAHPLFSLPSSLLFCTAHNLDPTSIHHLSLLPTSAGLSRVAAHPLLSLSLLYLTLYAVLHCTQPCRSSGLPGVAAHPLLCLPRPSLLAAAASGMLPRDRGGCSGGGHQVLLVHVMPCHVIPSNASSFHIIPHHSTSCRIMAHHSTSWHIIPHHAMMSRPCHFIW
ncbi:unnamed protein product [Closterium sp. NIES-54]